MARDLVLEALVKEYANAWEKLFEAKASIQDYFVIVHGVSMADSGISALIAELDRLEHCEASSRGRIVGKKPLERPDGVASLEDLVGELGED